jgi:RNA polymerase sigma factor (sigma-70 family)
VTYREKKAFLASYIVAENAIRASLLEYERWQAIGTKVNQVLSMVPIGSSEDKSKVEMAAIEMASVIDRIREEIDEANRKKEMVSNAINKMTRVYHRELLRYRYIGRMSNDKIADMLGKDAKTIEKTIRTAIYNFNP